MKRLNIEIIDLYYVYWIDFIILIEEIVEVMVELVKEGKVCYLGLSECFFELLKRVCNVYFIFVVESEYFLLIYDVEKEILLLIKELGVILVLFLLLGRGLVINIINVNVLEEYDFCKYLLCYNGKYWENN